MAYMRLAQRLQGLACFLAPTLLVLAYIMLFARTGPSGLWAGDELANASSPKLEYSFFAYWAFLLLIPAWYALVRLVGQTSPRLAATCAAVSLFGFGPLITDEYLQMNVAIAIRDGFPMNWDFFMNVDTLNLGKVVETTQVMDGVCLRSGMIVRCGPAGPRAVQLMIGLPILLYFLANIAVGVAVLRTGALPRWSGVLLTAAALLHFDSTGPHLSGLPLLTGLLSALCLMAVYSLVGLRLWRDEAKTAIMEPYRTTA